jgi:hypothetical protein
MVLQTRLQRELLFLTVFVVYPDEGVLLQHPGYFIRELMQYIDKVSSGMGITEGHLIVFAWQYRRRIAGQGVTHQRGNGGIRMACRQYLVQPFAGIADIGLEQGRLITLAEGGNHPGSVDAFSLCEFTGFALRLQYGGLIQDAVGGVIQMVVGLGRETPVAGRWPAARTGQRRWRRPPANPTSAAVSVDDRKAGQQSVCGSQ